MSIAHGTYKVNKKFDKFSSAESLINSEARTVKIFEIYHGAASFRHNPKRAKIP